MKNLQVDIVNPAEKLFSGEATSVTLPGSEGQFQVLFNHAPLIASLGKGVVKIKTETGEQQFPSSGGVVEVLKNKVIVLVEG
jgi:F-type H+-transporting ATPase subunit epsilon